LRETAKVIEHNWGRNAQQQILDPGDLLTLHVDLNMPAEIVYPFRQRLNHFYCRGAGLDQIETDSTDAEVVQALELGVRNAGIDHRNAAGSRPNLRQGIKGDAIIGPIGRGRHDDISRRTEALLQQLVIAD
jgi:hypothetical protein